MRYTFRRRRTFELNTVFYGQAKNTIILYATTVRLKSTSRPLVVAEAKRTMASVVSCYSSRPLVCSLSCFTILWKLCLHK